MGFGAGAEAAPGFRGHTPRAEGSGTPHGAAGRAARAEVDRARELTAGLTELGVLIRTSATSSEA